ncbi:MAG: LacI family DNA-binding transcriptional regulator [Spirochaetota bacterium]
MTKKVTARTVAEAAGVSVGTVDRAFNERGRINEETKKRILEAAKKLSYRPNRIASALGKRREIRFAVMLPREPAYFFDMMRKGFADAEKESRDYGVSVEYISTASLDPAAEEVALRSIDPSLYAGILINAGGPSINKQINAFSLAGVPVATFNSDIASSKRVFHVGHDDVSSGAIAAGLVGQFTMGRGDVAILTGFQRVRSHRQRVESFSKTLSEEYPGLKIIEVHEYEDSEERAFAAMKSLLERKKGLAAVFASSAPGAVGAGKAIAAANPDRIPSLVGYDISKHIRELMQNKFCSAVIYQDPYSQSNLALRAMVRHVLEGWVPESKHIYIASKIVIRQNIDEYLRASIRHEISASEILEK